MTPDEINAAICRALDAVRAGHKLEMSALENEIAKLRRQVAGLTLAMMERPAAVVTDEMIVR